jgi:CBS-domain-containing membrane protein/PII-like signaling protein
MELHGTAQQIWIFIGESDQWHGRPLYMVILETLKRHGCAGGTVLRGIAGFGAESLIHTASLVELSSDLPIVVTFVDRPDRVARVLPEIQMMVAEGMITSMPVDVLKYTHRIAGPFPAHLTVADIMRRDVVQVQPDTPVGEIVGLLIDRAVRALPVVDSHDHVVGIVTDGDLLTRGAVDLPLDVQRVLPLAERAAQVAVLADHPHTAADLMTARPHVLKRATPLAQAAAVMAQHDVKRMPVVDEQDRLVGIVSRSDLLATIAEGLRQRPSEPLYLPAGAPTTVGAVMLREVPTVQATTPLAETLDRLSETEKRRVVVVDERRHVLGIVTDGDILRRAAKPRPSALQSLVAWFGGAARPEELEIATRGRTAADVMTRPAITVATDTSIAEAVRLLILHRIKRLPVVDEREQLVGLVGRAGLLAALSRPTTNDQRPTTNDD